MFWCTVQRRRVTAACVDAPRLSVVIDLQGEELRWKDTLAGRGWASVPRCRRRPHPVRPHRRIQPPLPPSTPHAPHQKQADERWPDKICVIWAAALPPRTCCAHPGAREAAGWSRGCRRPSRPTTRVSISNRPRDRLRNQHGAGFDQKRSGLCPLNSEPHQPRTHESCNPNPTPETHTRNCQHQSTHSSP